MKIFNKNLFQQPFFWTSICCLLALGILVGLYSYAWVSPTSSPNTSAGAAINFYDGKVGIGTATPAYKLHIVGSGDPPGDPYGDLTLSNTTNTNQRLHFGYDKTSEYGWMEAVKVGSELKPIIINPRGGNVGIGSTTIPTEQLAVTGNVKIAGTGNGIKFPDGTSQTTAASGSSGAITAIPSGTTGTYSLNWDALQICQFGTCCTPWLDCDGDYRSYSGMIYNPSTYTVTGGQNRDCDEGCATCYVGSTEITNIADGKDQDCDGTVDELVGTWNTGYTLFRTNSAYNGNLGGRSGADTKCNSDANKPIDCVGNAWAMASFSTSDEVQDMPTTKGVSTSLGWAWINGTKSLPVATSWSTLLSTTAIYPCSRMSYISASAWFFSSSAGALDATYNCSLGLSTSGNGLTDSCGGGGVAFSGAGSTTSCANNMKLICACARNATVNVYQ